MTEKEKIVGVCADNIVDIASKDKPLDFEPFTDDQYVDIECAISVAIDEAVTRIVSQVEGWNE